MKHFRMNMIRGLVLGLLVCGGLSGCVYPYDSPVPANQYSGIVVEGDILVGGVSEISLGRLLPLTEEAPDSLLAPVDAEVRVENDLGDTYEAGAPFNGMYRIDLSSASHEGKYRLKIRTADGAVYSTAYAAPSGTCSIDNLKYNIEGKKVNILLDMHSDGESRHFRYSYHETWEYHSQVRAMLSYEPASPGYPYGIVSEGADNYYCWNKAYSRGINLFTTETMDVDRLDDYPIISRDFSDEKFSSFYRLDVDVYPVDSNSYRYYEHLKEVSTFTGSLFSPIPSELKGNVICESDPSRTAYGYVAVVRPSTRRLELASVDVGYYNPHPSSAGTTFAKGESSWPLLYRRGYLPVENDPMQGMLWAEARCVDCRLSGGTKNKPADWPTDHL